MTDHEKLDHGFGPFIPEHPKYLFLGTFPSVKSREQQFYYGHPQNIFWRLLADIFQDDRPESLTQKKAFLAKHGVAVYDVIESCEIIGSSDSSIRNIVPTDIESLVQAHGIKRIIVNGRLAEKIFHQYHPKLKAYYVLSSSPANAAMTYDTKLKQWTKAVLGEDHD